MKLSLRAKIVIVPIMISVVGLGVVVFLAAREVSLRTTEQLQREALLTASLFDADIENMEAVLDSVQVQDLIDKLTSERAEIVRFTFNGPVYEQAKIADYRTLASSDPSYIWLEIQPRIQEIIAADREEAQTVVVNGQSAVEVIAPIHAAGEALAAVEIIKLIVGNETAEFAMSRASWIAHLMDANVSTTEDFLNPGRLQSIIAELVRGHPEIVSFSFHGPVYQQPSVMEYRAMASSDHQTTGQLSKPDVIAPLVADETVLTTEMIEGEQLMRLIAPIHVDHKAVATVELLISLEQVRAETWRIFRYSTLAALVGIALISILLTIVLGQVVVRPISQLTASAQAMAAGDLLQEVETTSEDELGILANTFNSMAAQLRESIQNLEQRVVELRQVREILGQKDLLEGLLQNAPLAIVIEDMQKKIAEVNPAFEALFGFSEGEVHDLEIADILSTPETSDEMRAITNRSTKELQDVYTVGKRRRKDGTLVDVELFTTSYYVKGEQFGYLTFYNDISERLKAQAELAEAEETVESVLATIQELYLEANRTGVITYANLSFVKVLGYESVDDVIGHRFTKFTARSSWREIFSKYKRLYETKQSIDPFVYNARTKDGMELIGEAYISPIIEDNEVIGTRGFIRDITARVKAEQVLRETSLSLRERVKELDCLYGISALVETPGITLDEVLQGTVDLVPPAWQYPDITCARIFIGEQEYITENFVGSEWKISSDILVNGEAAGVLEVHCVEEKPEPAEGPFLEEEHHLIDEITKTLGRTIERVEVEEELRRSEQKYRTILDDIKEGYFEIDLYGNVVVANDILLDIYEVPYEDAVGANIIRYTDRDTARHLFSIFTNMVESRKPLKNVIFPIITRSGTEKTVELSASNIESVDGEVVGFRGICRDITERVKAEEALRRTFEAEAELAASQERLISVLDTLQDPYFEADPRGYITDANLAFVKTVHYSSKEEIIGKHFFRLAAQDREAIRSIMDNFKIVYETKQPAPPFEYIARRKDGELIIGEAYISPILEGDEVVGTRGFIRDITYRVKAEEALRQAKEEVEARAEELGTINRVATILNRSLNLDEILKSVCEELTRVFTIRTVFAGLLAPDQATLDVIAFHSTDPEKRYPSNVTLPLVDIPACKEAIDTKQPLILNHTQSQDMGALHEIMNLAEKPSILILPLIVRSKVIGLIFMSAEGQEQIFSESEIELAETIASQIAAAVDNAQLYAQTEIALGVAESDLEIGRQIQTSFFPEFLPEISGWEIATHFKAARQVAGDFFDIFQFDNSNFTAFIIADVCDKGVGAALFMVLFRSLIRAYSSIQINIDNVQEQLKNIVLNTNNFIAKTHGHSNMFAAIFFGILDPEGETLHYINGGLDPPVILDKDGNIIKRLMPTGPSVGMFPDMLFKVDKVSFNQGDIFFGFTDGTTDARNIDGNFFTEERLLEVIQASWVSSFSLLYDLNASLQKYIGYQNQYDDITQITIRRKLSPQDNNHSISRAAMLDNLIELRDFAEMAAKNNGLGVDDAFAFKLAAEEICTNIIQYGFEGSEPGSITLIFESGGGKATLRIIDDGIHFSPDQAETPDIDAGWEDRDLGGLGIYFVKELMQNVTYNKDEHNHNVLILKKDLNSNNLLMEG